MESFSLEGWYILLRWFHVLAGITWIGMLYYFNLVQTPFFGTELAGAAGGDRERHQGRGGRRGRPVGGAARSTSGSRVAHQHAVLDPDALLHGVGVALHIARHHAEPHALLDHRARARRRARAERA